LSTDALLLPFERALLRGAFDKRYKRFFVDLTLPAGETLTVHCANSGSMKSCLLPGAPAWALDSLNSERKLRHSLELLALEDGLACLNTARANTLTERFLLGAASGQAPFLSSLPSEQRALLAADFGQDFSLRREAKFSASTRFDFLLGRGSEATWLEVKSVSLRLDASTLAFPDAVTERGQKHLRELMQALALGDRAFLLFVFMRGAAQDPAMLARGFRAAHEIDPAYAALLSEATDKGVKVRILIPSITPSGFGIRGYFRYSEGPSRSMGS
jgi:sugar fermentation stimulation protein A